MTFISINQSVITDSITERWREHFSTLLNRPSTVDPSGLDAIAEKPTLEKLDLPPSLEEITKAAGPDRSAWHSRTRQAQEVFETNRRDHLANTREARKASTSSLSTTAAFQCPHCPRVCASRIGFSSHTRAHERRLSAR
ncbi:hypothetical protein Pcinc_009180 [Petrolisthes cinctipes]|uniref:C2H2-type domain-containing protein n=1 Tax=Petrolisthes cinctipes TaxID=88211 RepID=A0AAE1KQ38_PETCI|nr:hypothetical protein Pcinc_013680 [Petrolisthes cinctipes]KAK3886663.1 hypothetical protein Pcinc_009180 [Petrolisthes cinctipes]